MEERDDRSLTLLLSQLDAEIDSKCVELKEKHYNNRLKNVFFLSCLFIFISSIMQMIFKIFEVSFIFTSILYIVIAIAFSAPFIAYLFKGEVRSDRTREIY